MSLTLRFILAFSLITVFGHVYAGKIYKGMDEEGNVIFSDKPLPDSKPIDVKPNVVEVEGAPTQSSGTPTNKPNNNGSDSGTGSAAAGGVVPHRGRIEDRPPHKVDKPKTEPHKAPKKHYPRR